MVRAALLALVAACTPHVVYRDLKPDSVIVTAPCLVIAPPSPPPYVPCTDTEHECRDLDNARQADYAQELGRWVALYAWPSCSDATGTGSDRYAEHARSAAVPARPDERP